MWGCAGRDLGRPGKSSSAFVRWNGQRKQSGFGFGHDRRLLKKLVTAGFSFDSSLELVNAALLAKSEEESLSTIDVATIDLYSGETQFLKAGAAPTFVYRDGSVV